MKAIVRADNVVIDFSDDDVVWTLEEGMREEHVDGSFVPEHDPWDYRWVDGAPVYIAPPPATLCAEEVLTAMFAAQPDAIERLPDEALARMAPYMQPWEPDAAYEAGNLRSYLEVPYRCLQAHQAQEAWNPADSPSLWAKVLIPDPTVIPEWEQPSSTNPYMKGDKVRHNGKTWVSDVDNNVWEPGVYGWTEVA